MAKIKAIILDCDGVILNSNHAYEEMYDTLFRKYGVKKRAREIYMHFGESPMHILHAFFPHRNIDTIFRDYKKQLKQNKFNKKIKIHPGAHRAIARMSKNYTVVVASGALRLRLVKSLKHFGLWRYLAFAMGSDQVKNAKPHPEMLLRIIERLGVKKSEVIFVGDAPNDRIAAKRAGIKFIAVLSGVFDRRLAKKMKSDYIVSDITRVQKLVDELV